MAKIIPIRFRRPLLPRPQLASVWWLKSSPVRSNVVALPNRVAPKPSAKSKVRHLTLITSGN
jgi:hypothetical protein